MSFSHTLHIMTENGTVPDMGTIARVLALVSPAPVSCEKLSGSDAPADMPLDMSILAPLPGGSDTGRIRAWGARLPGEDIYVRIMTDCLRLHFETEDAVASSWIERLSDALREVGEIETYAAAYDDEGDQSWFGVRIDTDDYGWMEETFTSWRKGLLARALTQGRSPQEMEKDPHSPTYPFTNLVDHYESMFPF